MKTVSIRDMQERFDELVHAVEQGETLVVTRDGQAKFDLVPREDAAPRKGGVDFEAMQAHLRALGVTDPFPYVADDFDDPLPEDFLLRPLP